MADAYKLKEIRFSQSRNFSLDLPELTIPSGGITALLGRNGSGKSTLLNLLALLYPPQKGNIRFFDQPLDSHARRKNRKRIGYLMQKPFMLRGTVLDNIHLALKLHGCAKTIRSHKAAAILEQLDLGYCAQQQAQELSGGELQKAALARILVLKPDVLLLDEPFSYLDHTAASELENLIQGFTEQPGRTLIFSTHNRIQGIAIANNVVSLVHGRSVPTPLVNVFNGKIDRQIFDTGNISITLPDDISTGCHISIEPREIILSRIPLHSSIRNHYSGRVTGIAEEAGNIRVTIDAGETFHALITHQSLAELDLNFGCTAWLHFKSNSVTVF